MSFADFDDNCPGCQPVLLDPKTGRSFGKDTPEMQAILGVWRETPLEERRAFHRVCCLNSREPADTAVIQVLSQRMQQALARALAS